MRKPRIGDEWRLKWMKHKPVKTIGSFGWIWLRSRGCAVPSVWFEHQPKGKTITCSVRYLLENGELVTSAEQRALLCRWCNKPEADHTPTMRHKFLAQK